ncbi:FAD/NAD-P-binding domain-containing protein [Mycena latifolia]|nr:FAD/NAD-P-binding domain-containing protein [Mycena latifolia]
MSSPSKNIIIIGGSPSGGVAALRALLPKLPTARITLINPLPYAICRPSLPRMTVSDHNELLDTALIPYDKLFTTPNGVFVEGTVVAIEANKNSEGGMVVLADGLRHPYDALVLAPGSVWEGPLDIPEESKAVKDFIAASRAGFKKAQRIVLVGGGAVGLEYAGEIKDIWPEKEVTIVHGASSVMNSTYPDRFRNNIENDLRARGVNIILNDHVDEFPPPGALTVKTRNGNMIDADLVVPTRGPRPRTEFVAKSLGADTLDERKQIKVKPTMQLLDYPDIFAIGDAINTVEQKQVPKAGAHAAVAAANIITYLTGSRSPLKEYKGSVEMIIVTNGKDGGRGYFGILWGITLGPWFARLIKSRGLLVSMTRSSMGY